MSDLWSSMFDAETPRSWLNLSLRCESWRYSKAEQIVGVVGHDTITCDEEKHARAAEKFPSQVLTLAILRARDEFGKTIRSHLSTSSPTTDLPQIQNLVDKAFILAGEMSLQRSCLQVTYPTVGNDFDKAGMSSMPD
jgi:hypothetical protein